MRLAVLASGGGTNFQAILDAIDSGRLQANVVLCASNRESAGALDRARGAGIPAVVLDPDDGAALLEQLEEHGADFIALAGYLRRIPEPVIDRFRNRIVNIHPGLLPAFGGKGMYGKHVHRAVIERGVRWTGVTVHLVDEDYDTGPIVLQDVVPVEQGDTPETLAARVLNTEHRVYPEALRLFAEQRVRVDGRRTVILSPSPNPTS